jgi:hypothetical protein
MREGRLSSRLSLSLRTIFLEEPLHAFQIMRQLIWNRAH